MLISEPPRAGNRFPEARRGSATLRMLAGPVPLAASSRMLAGPAERPVRLGGAFLSRTLVGRAPHRAAPRVPAHPALIRGRGARAGGRDGLPCGPARGAVPAALSPRAPRGSWNPPVPGRRAAALPRLWLGLAWAHLVSLL